MFSKDELGTLDMILKDYCRWRAHDTSTFVLMQQRISEELAALDQPAEAFDLDSLPADLRARAEQMRKDGAR